MRAKNEIFGCLLEQVNRTSTANLDSMEISAVIVQNALLVIAEVLTDIRDLLVPDLPTSKMQ